MRDAVRALCDEASKAIEAGATLSSCPTAASTADHAAIPSLLATGAVHHHLIREGTRIKVGLVVESGEPREVHHLARAHRLRRRRGQPVPRVRDAGTRCASAARMLNPVDFHTAEKNYVKALHKGVLKVMSKMGISTLQSYRGAQIFEAVGSRPALHRLSTSPGRRRASAASASTRSRSRRWHATRLRLPRCARRPAWLELKPGGYYQWRRDGEYHMYNPDTISLLQYSTRMQQLRFLPAVRRAGRTPRARASAPSAACSTSSRATPSQSTRSSPRPRSSSASPPARCPSARSAATRTRRWPSR